MIYVVNTAYFYDDMLDVWYEQRKSESNDKSI